MGATSVLLSLIGFLRWVFVVPPLAHAYVTGDATTKAAVDAAWTAQHQFGGALLGEHLGGLLAIGWSITLCVIILRSRVLPLWLGVTGLIVSVLYLLNQGDIMATAAPRLPDLGPRGADRQHQLGTVGGRPRSDPPPAPHPRSGPLHRGQRGHPVHARRDPAGHCPPEEPRDPRRSIPTWVPARFG